MLRRVHEILSKKFPKWVFEERTEPLDWSILPVEMKREIVKHTDFETKCRLRQCSVQDKQIVDSLKVSIPLVRIETDRNYMSVMICENRNRVVRVDLKKKNKRLRKKFTMKISDNIHGSNAKEVCSNCESEAIFESLLKSVYRDNVTIETLNLSLKYPNDIITKYLDIHYREVIGPRRRTKILCSDLDFLIAQVHFLPVDETRVINNLVTNYEEGRIMMAGKKYNVSPMGHFASIGVTSFWKPSLLACNLGALIAGIIWKINTEMECYYIPGLRVPEYQEYCDRFEGRITKHNDILVLHIPARDPDNNQKLIIKMNKCGVVIEKRRFEDVPVFEKDKCILDWMCASCDKSVESWYFRAKHGIEN
ncbi:hypothetical protein GCK72_019042 [Caenorhabditis remanei]|uniref:F-box domain-containing protein n=1 Tax=Caenorhabditis remanei TaxID=31234 RepID=A0A6A5GB97_CAERE|nr:hypothetical protein GCK72_019042 [Caenorhabditis remanei]KAF1752487.1 hypothetical protein GCK72_019042 [Caenorhabditis remanei]